MDNCITKIIKGKFDEILHSVKESLNREDFEVIYEIDMQKRIKEKFGDNFKKYMIFGVSNITFDYKILQEDSKTGTSLPCNFVIQQINDNEVDIMLIDPLCSLKPSKNELLVALTYELKVKLTRVMDSISISRNSEFYF